MNLIEPKHVIPYLPHGLSVINKAFGKEKLLMTGIETETPSSQERIVFKTKEGNFYKGYFYETKPLLYPMYDLKKPIHIEGREIVPIEEIFKLVFGDFEGTVELHQINGVDYYQADYKVMSRDVWEWPAYCFHKLYEWKFDVFELIENNLAVDINTLTTQNK